MRKDMGPVRCVFILLILKWTCLGQAMYVMVAPNLLHIENDETVYLEARGETQNVQVAVQVQDLPLKRHILFKGEKSLNSGNNHQDIIKIKISKNELRRDFGKKTQFVNLNVQFKGSTEKVVDMPILMSFQSGYVFLQTDKPIYNPGENVQYRVYVTNIQVKSITNIVTVDVKNPEGITVHQEMGIKVADGILGRIYTLPEIAIEGNWTLEVRLQDWPEEVFSTQFDVRKHVLPTFEVKLTPEKKFFHVNDKMLNVDVEARYLFGKDVEGSAYVTFGVVTKNGTKISFPSSLQRVDLREGKSRATLQQQHIIIKDINNILGDLIYARATVFTITGSDIVEAETRVQVTRSPYKILFTKSSRYFKPGMPNSLHVQVTHADGTPAERVTVKTTDQIAVTDSHGAALLVVNTGQQETSKVVKVSTDVPNIPDDHQAKEEITLFRYETKGVAEYLHLSIAGTMVSTEDLQVTLNFYTGDRSLQTDFISYMVLSKARIIQMGKWRVEQGLQVMKQTLRVTKDMLPSFRLVAYYTVPQRNHDVVSDSLWIDMEDMCEGTLEVSLSRPRSQFRPGEQVALQVKVDPKAKVGMVITDKAAYSLSKKGLLTQSKIWDAVEDGDVGCTRGGGQNNMGVFADAGLVFWSSTGEQTATRTSLHCSADKAQHRKRRATLTEVELELQSRYNDDHLRKCCRDGMTEFPLSYACEKRALYITDSQECVKAFLRCCVDMREKKLLYRSPELILSRSNDLDFRESEIYVRSKFEVSFMWRTLPLEDAVERDGLDTYRLNAPLQDSITEWRVLAISASSTKGVCVAKPLEITVAKMFFVDLRLPYSIVNKEQVSIRAVLHNYYNEDIEFIVELEKNEFLCSLASASGKFRQTVMVPAETTSAVHFTIVPLKKGSHKVRVRAFNRQLEIGDAIEKPLLVVAEGVEKIVKTVKIIDLSSAGRQVETISLPPLRSQVPGTDTISDITILGDELADTIENSIKGKVLADLIKMPSGCVEQNLVSMTCPIIATHYLDNANEWETVGFQKRDAALSHIRTGYQNHLNYRKEDDSYPPYSGFALSSTWVTAYTVKVFAMAYGSGEGSVDVDRICGSVRYLILMKQAPNGRFEEDAPIRSERLTGSSTSEGSTGLTAFVLIALAEAQTICQHSVPNLDSRMDMATQFLTEELPKLTSPYAVAIVSYALALRDAPREMLLRKLKSTGFRDGHRWGENNEVGLETTGYALMALLKMDEVHLAGPVSRWLSEQASDKGQFGSTQSTMVVFQSLAQYKLVVPQYKNAHLDVQLSISDVRRRRVTWTLTRNTWSVARSEKVHNIQNFTMEAEGRGTGKIVFVTKYNAMPEPEHESCEGYAMNINMLRASPLEVQERHNARLPETIDKAYILTICLRLLPGTPETMTILDVSIPTGFVPSKDALDTLKNRVDSLLDYYSMDKELSHRGSLIIHLYKVPKDTEHCVPVVLYQEFLGGLLQPSAVTVYAYYQKERNCTQFYHPEGNSPHLGTICSGVVCTCAENTCPSPKKSDDDDRYARACSSTTYVYKMKMVDMKSNKLHDTYIMEIIEVIKTGQELVVAGNRREFLSHVSCRGPMGLKSNDEYLVIGMPHSLLRMPDGGYVYVLMVDTWLERIPTESECRKDLKATCLAIQSFADEMVLFGCPN